MLKDEDYERWLDWGHGSEGSEGRRHAAARGSRGVQDRRPVLPATPEVEAEYQSTLVELKVRRLCYTLASRLDDIVSFHADRAGNKHVSFCSSGLRVSCALIP